MGDGKGVGGGGGRDEFGPLPDQYLDRDIKSLEQKRECGVGVEITETTITVYFIHPSGKLKLSFDRETKNISQ